LFACHATYVESPRIGKSLPPVCIRLPDGTIASSEQPDIDRVLSDALGRDVSLITTPPAVPQRESYVVDHDGVVHAEKIKDGPLAVAAPADTFFDYAALHILTGNCMSR
jgi:hypothetical protein